VARILVTGASGFLGRYVLDNLIPNDEVIGVAFESSHRPRAHDATWVHWDIRDAATPNLLPPFDAVVHLAQARNYRRFPELAGEIASVNIGGLVNVLEAARAAGAKRFVLASSGGVYPAGPGLRKEADQPAPGNFYQATKLAGEFLASAYRGFFDVTCLRLFFPYGPGQPPTRFIPDLVRRVMTGEPVQLNGTDGLAANPVYAGDAAVAFQRALALDGSHVINVAGGEVLTLRQMVQWIGESVGRRPVLEQVGDRGSRDLVADITQMKAHLGAPASRFEERIGEVCRELISAHTR
jgi:nucleoside-diphosphate-sugar epimerase